MGNKKSAIAEKRAKMKYTSPTSLHYLSLRKKSLTVGLTKARVIPYVLNYIRNIIAKPKEIPAIADFGCSEGLMLGRIKEIFDETHPTYPIDYYGFDYNKSLIENASKANSGIKFRQADLTKSNSLKKYSNRFDVVIVVNTLHEIFSFYSFNGTFDEKKGKRYLLKSLKTIIETLKPGGKLIIFDGVEHSARLNKQITIKLQSKEAILALKKFQKNYKPIKVKLDWISKNTAKIDIKTFTRFITKTIFLNTPVWKMEQEEMYQYFTTQEYEDTLNKLGLTIEARDLLSPNLKTWHSFAKIEDSGISYPNEHILIVGSKN